MYNKVYYVIHNRSEHDATDDELIAICETEPQARILFKSLIDTGSQKRFRYLILSRVVTNSDGLIINMTAIAQAYVKPYAYEHGEFASGIRR